MRQRIRFFFADVQIGFKALEAMDLEDMNAGRTATEINVAVHRGLGIILSVGDPEREKLFARFLEEHFPLQYSAVQPGEVLVKLLSPIPLKDSRSSDSLRTKKEPGLYVLTVVKNPHSSAGASWLVIKGTSLGMAELAWREYTADDLIIVLDYLGTRLPGHSFETGDLALISELDNKVVFVSLLTRNSDLLMVRVDSNRALVVGPYGYESVGSTIMVRPGEMVRVVAILP